MSSSLELDGQIILSTILKWYIIVNLVCTCCLMEQSAVSILYTVSLFIAPLKYQIWRLPPPVCRVQTTRKFTLGRMCGTKLINWRTTASVHAWLQTSGLPTQPDQVRGHSVHDQPWTRQSRRRDFRQCVWSVATLAPSSCQCHPSGVLASHSTENCRSTST